MNFFFLLRIIKVFYISKKQKKKTFIPPFKTKIINELHEKNHFTLSLVFLANLMTGKAIHIKLSLVLQ
jgi:hypothetical protein